MSGGQQQTQNQTQNRSPYAPAIPGLQRSLTDADSLYTSGVGGGVYGGQRVASFTEDQSRGIQSIRDQAAADNAGPIGVDYLQNLLGSNGIGATTQRGLDMLASVPNVDTSRLSALASRLADPNNQVNQTASAFMSGARDINTEGDLRSLLARALAPSSAETNLSATARGDYLDPTANPWVSKLAATSADNAAQAQKEAFAASGRYGSGAFAGATAKAVNDTQSALYADQYNRERQNQLAANAQVDTARQTGTQLGKGIVGDITDVQSRNNQFRLAGAGIAQGQTAQEAGVLGQVLGGDQFNSSLGLQKASGFIGAGQQATSAGLQAASMLPALDALRYAPGQQLLGVGAGQQAQTQADLDAVQQEFQERQQAPWQLLSQYSAFPMGIGTQGGTTNTTGVTRTQVAAPSAGQQALGIGLALAGLGTGGGTTLGGSLLGAGASGIGGAIGGALPASILPFSDERMKDDVREVGKLHDGQPIYSYRYKGDPRTQIGLIAQEVAEREPGAVAEKPGTGGLLGVDYRKATDRAAEIGRTPGLGELMSDGRGNYLHDGKAGLGRAAAGPAPQEPASSRNRAKPSPPRRKAA